MRGLVLLVGACGLLLLAYDNHCKKCPAPSPKVDPTPKPPSPPPGPPPGPETPKPRKPWGDEEGPVGSTGQFGKISLGGQTGPAGQEVQCDLPVGVRIRNIGSKVDGAGMCVSTSMTHAARWHNMREWYNWRDWCAKFRGGGYPSKMETQIKQFAAEMRVPVPPYLNYQGKDLAVVEEALKAGIMASVTYSGRDGVRYSGSIAHMVNLVYLDDKSAAVMDNNGKPEDLIWMSRDEFKARWSGWAFFWLLPPPPPPPFN